jgi:hypothetical protein
MVDEAGLDGLPLGDEAVALGGAEFADFHLFYAVFASGKFSFGLGRGSVLNDSAVIFRTEAIFEAESPGLAMFKVHREGDGNDDAEYNHGDDDLDRRELEWHSSSPVHGMPATAGVRKASSPGQGGIRNQYQAEKGIDAGYNCSLRID